MSGRRLKKGKLKAKRITKLAGFSTDLILLKKNDARIFEGLEHRRNTSERMLRKNNKIPKVCEAKQ